MIGRTVGKYRVLERIGRGGMGTVYLATDETLQRDVAIKVLNADITEPEALKRFRAEALTLARLQHPAIATLFELFEDQGDLLMVMEFVRGETLQRLAERMGRVPPDFAAQLCAQALDGLGHAHKSGIVHRDLKPGNIMVTDDGLVKVMDFGIARITGSEHLTSDGLSMGTPAYMAPEQVLGREVDGRADLYAIGVVLYRLWTGQLPFEGTTPFAIANKQLNDHHTPLNVAYPELPAWCDAVLARALAKRPEDRYQTAQEFKAALVASARFIALDDVATMTMATPRGVSTSAVPSGMGPMASGTSRAHHTAGATQGVGESGGRTLVISAKQLFASVGTIIVAFVLIAIAGVFAIKRLQTPASSGTPAQQQTPPQADSAPAVPPQAVAAPGNAVRPPLPPAAAGSKSPAAATPPNPKSASDGEARTPAAPGKTPDAVPATTTPPAAAALPSMTFERLKVVIVEGDKAREENGQVQLAGGRATIYGENKRVVAALPFDTIRAVTSARSRQPRWRQPDGRIAEAKLGGGPLGFMKSDRNWLALVTPRTAYVLRVDEDNLRELSRAVAERTGAPVVRLPSK